MNHRPTRLGTQILASAVAGALTMAQMPSAWAQARPDAGAPAKPAAATAKPAAASRAELTAAKKHYGEGDKKYKAGDFAGAEVEFRAANDVKATPQAERFIGLCEDAQGHFAVAADWYDRFLAHVPEKLATQGDEIRKRDAEIKALPGKLHIDTNPTGASIAVDDKPQSATTPTDLELAPGPHKIRLTETGRLATEKSVDVAFASSQTVSADLDAEPPPPPPPVPLAVVTSPPPPPPAPPAEPRSLVPAYVTGGLAIIGAGVGTAFGIIALNDKSDFNKNHTSAIADNVDQHALICDMSLGVAITFGVTSAVLFLTRDEPASAMATPQKSRIAKADADKRSGVTVSATPLVGPHTGGAGVLVRF